MSLLCCVDFSPLSDAVLAEAERLARAFATSVILVHAVPTEPPLSSGGAIPTGHRTPAWDTDERKRRLDAEVARLRERGIPTEGHLLIDEQPAEAIAQAVKDRDASHVVIGSHGHAMVFELLVGSFTQAVLRRVSVPVVVVPVSRTEA